MASGEGAAQDTCAAQRKQPLRVTVKALASKIPRDAKLFSVIQAPGTVAPWHPWHVQVASSAQVPGLQDTAQLTPCASACQADNIVQGELGDCWLLAAMAAGS